MKSYNLKIHQNDEVKDLTIIYKEFENNFHELKTTKSQFLKSLKYFQKKSNEINQMNYVYIQENVNYNIFHEFISSIITKEININENNYESFLYLCQKFEYEDLQKEIENFIENRPDIHSIADDIINSKSPIESANQNENSIDAAKEEIFAKNIDICIKNQILHKLPIQVIIRILNSPKRVVNDHHLLFSFVIEMLKEMQNKSSLKEEEKQCLSLLPSSLDYCLMSSEEIEELFEIENENDSFFQPKNSEKRMKKFISFENEMKKKFEALEKEIQANEEKHNVEIQNIKKACEENERQLIDILNKKEEELLKKFNDYQIKNNEQINKNEKLINEIKEKQENTEARYIELKSLNDQLRKENETVKSEINKIHQNNPKQNIIECPDGVFQYLFDKYKSNPVDYGVVEISGNSIGFKNQLILRKIIDLNFEKWWQSNSEKNSFIRINFKNSKVKINKYRLRIGSPSGKHLFTSWILKGFMEDNQEVILDEVNESTEITESNSEITKLITNNDPPFVYSINLIMKGKSSDNDSSMRLRNIELFGYLQAS